MNKLCIIVNKKTAKALREGRRFVLLPCRGIYNTIFRDVGDRALCEFVYGEWRMTEICNISFGYAPKEMGGYVGQKYYILRFTQNSEE